MKRLNVIKVIDEWGWSYYFMGMEQKKYSRHNIILQKYNELNLSGADLVYVHSPDITQTISYTMPALIKQNKIKMIGGYGAFLPTLWSKEVSAVSSISPQTYQYARSMYEDKPILFVPESVDDEFFKPDRQPHEGFRVGFAGRLGSVKRPWLLKQLKYPVIMQTEWGKEFFVEGRDLSPMRAFYNSIDVLVLVSKSEAMPRVVMEAMACGTPVIATAVGSIPMMIGKEWLIPAEPEGMIVKMMNARLERLEKEPQLREETGQINRKRVESHLSWQVNSKIWDDIFEAVYTEDYVKAQELSKYIYNKLGGPELPLLPKRIVHPAQPLQSVNRQLLQRRRMYRW